MIASMSPPTTGTSRAAQLRAALDDFEPSTPTTMRPLVARTSSLVIDVTSVTILLSGVGCSLLPNDPQLAAVRPAPRLVLASALSYRAVVSRSPGGAGRWYTGDWGGNPDDVHPATGKAVDAEDTVQSAPSRRRWKAEARDADRGAEPGSQTSTV